MEKIFEKYGWTSEGPYGGLQLFGKESSKFFIVVRDDAEETSKWEAKRRGRHASDKVVAVGGEEQLEDFLKIAG